MSDEARNVEILKPIYQRWSDSKGGSVDDWMNVCAGNIEFGSLAQGARFSALRVVLSSSPLGLLSSVVFQWVPRNEPSLSKRPPTLS